MALDRCVIRKRKGFVPEMTEIVRVSPVVTGGGAAAAAEVTDNAETEQPPEPGEDHPGEGGDARPE